MLHTTKPPAAASHCMEPSNQESASGSSWEEGRRCERVSAHSPSVQSGHRSPDTPARDTTISHVDLVFDSIGDSCLLHLEVAPIAGQMVTNSGTPPCQLLCVCQLQRGSWLGPLLRVCLAASPHLLQSEFGEPELEQVHPAMPFFGASFHASSTTTLRHQSNTALSICGCAGYEQGQQRSRKVVLMDTRSAAMDAWLICRGEA